MPGTFKVIHGVPTCLSHVLPTRLDHHFINLRHCDELWLLLEQLIQDSSVTATQDQNLLVLVVIATNSTHSESIDPVTFTQHWSTEK